MTKPKNIQILILLWAVASICFLIHVLYFYHYSFNVEYDDISYNIRNGGLFIGSFAFFAISLLIIYITYFGKKWSWIINALFSFYFLLYTGQQLIFTITEITFLSSYKSNQAIYSIPAHQVFTVTNFIMPAIFLIIFILLFKPDVKKYLKIHVLEG